MPRACCLAFTLSLFLTAHAAAAPLRTRYDPAFYAPSEQVVTPHIPWARPYARGPIKALFLINRQNQREVIELAQRLQMDYTVFCTEDATKFGETGVGVDMSWRLVQGNSAEELATQLRGYLKTDYDVIVVGNITWDTLPIDCRYEILRKLKAGTGLVGYMPNGHDEYLGRILGDRDFHWNYTNWDGGAEGVPDYFGIGDFVGAVDTADPHSGTGCIRVTGREVKMGSREEPRGGYYLPPLKVEPNTQYRFSIWYRTARGGAPRVSLYPIPSDLVLPPSEAWQHAETTVNTGAHDQIGIYLLNYAVGDVWFDDVSLTRLGQEPNLLANPGFEQPGPAPEALIQGVPFPALPAFSRFASAADFARGTLQVSQFGEGRVALLQGFGVPVTQALTPPPEGPLGASQLDYDYYLAVAIKAILWGARKEPPVSITCPQPSVTLSRADLASAPPAFELTGPDGACGYACTVRDRLGHTWPAGAGKARLNAGRGAITPDLPSLPAGRYFLDLRLVPDGSSTEDPATPTVSFASVALTVTSPVRFTALTLDQPSYRNGQPLTGTATIEQPHPGLILRVRAWDNLNRLLGETSLAADAPQVAFQVPTLPACSIMARLEAVLMERREALDVREAGYTVQDFAPDPQDLRHVVWTSPGNDFISPYVLQGFREHGVDTQYTNFTPQIPAANLWHIPYLTRFVDAKTDWYLPKPVRQPDDLVREPCLTDPDYLSRLAAELTSGARAVLPYATTEFSLGDECHFVAGNWDLCMSPTCNADFRRFLQAEYGSLEALNAEWGTSHASWEDVVPITLDEARRTGRYPQWVDHRRHMERVYASIYEFSRAQLQGVLPGARVGYEGSDTEVGSFHANDYWQLARAMEFNNIYYRDFLTSAVRDFANPSTLLGAGWYGGYPNCRNEPFMRWFPWRALFKGSNSLWIWAGYGSAGCVMAYDLSLYPFYQVNCDEVNQIKAGPGKLLITSQRRHDGIALLWSPSSVHAAQITDGFPSMDATLNGLVRVVHDIGLECKVVSYQQLAEGQVTNQEFRVLLLPGAQAMSPAEAEAVQRFASGGGTVIADLRPAVCDAHGKPYPTGLLDDLFGVQQDAARFSPLTGDLPLPDDQGALTGVVADGGLSVTTGAAGASIGNTPALITCPREDSRAVLLNASLSGYEGAERAAASGGEDFGGWSAGDPTRRLLASLLSTAGVDPAVRVSPELPQVEISRFRNEAAEYVGLIQGLPRDATAYTNQIAEWPPARPVTITFSRAAHVYDLRTGRYLGFTDHLATDLRPGIAHLYALLPYRARALDLLAPATSRLGRPLDFRFRVTTGGPVAQSHVIHLTALDPAGREHACYSANLLAPHGHGSGSFTPALNDPPGVWTLRARDVATGLTRECKVTLAAR